MTTKQTPTTQNREKIIVRTSIVGIIANIFLAGFKAAVGLAVSSIAVILDAVNNLSDALSSIVTIVGTFLAGRKPDKDHPLGHGRVEYISAMVVAALILYAGFTSLIESVKKIINPTKPDYTIPSLIIISSAIIIKLILGKYVKSKGKSVNSKALEASGTDAFFDAILSLSVLISAIIFIVFNISLEAYVGVIISIIIIKSGIEMFKETYDDIIGRRADRDFVSKIKQVICKDKDVYGAYDLILHSYGPQRIVGSVHVEILDTMTAEEIDLMQRRIANKVYEETNVILTGIGIYSRNTTSDEIKEIRSNITHIITSHEGVLQIHGFYVNSEKKIISLDIILDFELDNREVEFNTIKNEIETAYPEYTIDITMDIDV